MHALRAFLAWPAGASLLYLLSAACLLGGAALVLSPGSGDEARTAERFTALGTVAVYVATLSGLAGLVCRWRPGNRDAVALLVLLALFLPGMHAGLSTIASHFPLATLVLGAGGLALALAAGHQLQRRVTGRWTWRLLAPLVAMTTWNALAPGLLGLAYHEDMRPETLVGVWLPGWWLVLAAGAWLLFEARMARPSTQPDVVHGTGLRWILSMIAVLATCLHQWTLSYAFNLGLTAGDIFGPVIVLSLLLGILARCWSLMPPSALAVCEALLGIVGSAAALSGNFLAVPADPLWLICYPPALLAAGGVALLMIAWRWNQAHTAAAAGVWLLGCIVSWGITADDTQANLRALAVAVYVLAAGVVAVAGSTHRIVPVLSICVVTLGAMLSGGAMTLAICALAFTVRGIRTHSVREALPGTLPLAVHAAPYLPWIMKVIAAAGGWLGVGAAFALLALGAWISWRRARPQAAVSAPDQAP